MRPAKEWKATGTNGREASRGPRKNKGRGEGRSERGILSVGEGRGAGQGGRKGGEGKTKEG